MVWLSMHIYFNEGSFDHQHVQFIIFQPASQKQGCQCFPASEKEGYTLRTSAVMITETTLPPKRFIRFNSKLDHHLVAMFMSTLVQHILQF